MTSTTTLSTREDPLPGSVTQLASAYRRALEGQAKSPRTIQAYLEALVRLDAFLRRTDMPRRVALLRRDHLEAFIGDVRSSQSPATALARYRALQSFFRWCEAEGEIDRNPMSETRPPELSRRSTSVSSAATAVIPPDALAGLLRACEGRELRDLRDMAIIRLFVDTGLRRNDLAMLQVADVDLRGRTVTIPGRGGLLRRVSLTKTTAHALARYLRARAGHPDVSSPALWLGHGGPMTGNGIYQAIEARTVRAGLERIHPNQLRRTFVHAQVRGGTPERAEEGPSAASTVPVRAPEAPAAPAPAAAPNHSVTGVDETVGDQGTDLDLEAGSGVRTPEPGSAPPRHVFGASAGSRGAARATTLVVAKGLSDVVSVAQFKRHLGRLAGVREVSVSSGRDESFVFDVAHDPATSIRELLPTLPGFAARILYAADGIVEVRVGDPET